jgi:light-regulated signal transduction histidine kinase (bacteriophytochrome)
MEKLKDKILIVDDNPKNVQVLASLLMQNNYDLEYAINGQEALLWIEKEKFNLILLDIRMPDMDGFEVCRRIKSDENSRDIPVIFITALNEPSDKTKGFEIGGVDYITKPFEPNEVLARLKTHIRLRELTVHLEQEVQERTEEIVTINQQLHAEISERKIAEAQIVKLNMELEKRVTERTLQLETVNRELESFAYSVSHDLRAPLRGIDGFSQALLEEYQDKVDEQGKNYLQRIRLATQRMAQLIDDILNLSRITRSEINIQQVDLSKIAWDIVNDLEESQPERHVEFFIQEGIIIQADSHLLHIALENLIGNALKFTSKHPTARIEFGVHQQQDGLPVYFIRDDGAGFEMNYAQKLFGAFQRLHDAKEFSGTGIGLATVQRIIHRHGGKVWAEGEVEKGATFYFTIP